MQARHSPRHLVDVLDNEYGYVRVFADPEGFGYDVCAYRAHPLADLFQTMGGFATQGEALEAARRQLTTLQPRSSRRRASTRRASLRPSAPTDAMQLRMLEGSVNGDS
jgi:hypothetical protein